MCSYAVRAPRSNKRRRPEGRPSLRRYTEAADLVPTVLVAFVVTCRGCRAQVLAADVIDDEAECVLRDHLMLAHLDVLQPETRRELLRLFQVVPVLPPAV